MLTVVFTALTLFGMVLAAFTLYEIALAVLSVWQLWRERAVPASLGQGILKFGIIVPAHDEELLIGDVVSSLMGLDYPKDCYTVLVIADNCTDQTAIRARAAGATCFERFDAVRRGKPYALDWLISRIDLNAYDAFVIIDADTLVKSDFLRVMEAELNDGHPVIQGYFGVQNPDENWLTRLSILPGILKFRMHFPGKKLLGWSCPLAGNGMCFSADIFRRHGWKAYSIAENWEYYIMLLLEGYCPTSAERAVIYSQVAKSLKTGKNQRTRWLQGRIDTLARYWRPLAQRAFGGGGLMYLDALVELARPSHSILFLWSSLFFAAVAALDVAISVPQWLFWLAAGNLGLQVSYFLTGLVAQRAPLRTWFSLIMVPPYLFWKLGVSVGGLLNYRDRRWDKTERHK